MEITKLLEQNVFVWDVADELTEVPPEQFMFAVMVYKERFSDSQLRRVKAAIDRETLHRSKLIQSQTKAT